MYYIVVKIHKFFLKFPHISKIARVSGMFQVFCASYRASSSQRGASCLLGGGCFPPDWGECFSPRWGRGEGAQQPLLVGGRAGEDAPHPVMGRVPAPVGGGGVLPSSGGG